MKMLFNGCYRSEIKVIPNNWKTKKASLNKEWRIYYRFYDPVFKNEVKKFPKQISIKGMNRFRVLEERQAATSALIDNEINLLDNMGMNPITGQFMAPGANKTYEIAPSTKFIEALNKAYFKIDAVNGTKVDIRSVIKGVKKAASVLFDNRKHCNYDQLPISDISLRHIKSILEHLSQHNARWSNNRHNKYKAYLSMLFKQLIESEAIEVNPTRDLSYKKKIKKMRPILTKEEEIKINEHLKNNHYYFWRLIRIFFDSQARETELMKLRKDEKVNIDRQEFIVTVKKGNIVREDIRVISREVIPLWKEVWNEASHGQYLFSKGLKPGNSPIRPDQFGRRWKKYVKSTKTGLGINKDLYALKSLYTDKMAEYYGLELASKGAGHTNIITTRNFYAINQKQRELDLLKEKKVSFGE